ncbi:MAG: hypothetical protein R3F11_16920 [Verrucomicrobiales bacterium]
MQTLAPLAERFGKDLKGVIGCVDHLVLFGTSKSHRGARLLGASLILEAAMWFGRSALIRAVIIGSPINRGVAPQDPSLEGAKGWVLDV